MRAAWLLGMCVPLAGPLPARAAPAQDLLHDCGLAVEMGMAITEASAKLLRALNPGRVEPAMDALLRGLRDMLSESGMSQAHFQFCESVALSLSDLQDDAIVASTRHRQTPAGRRWMQLRQALGVRATMDTLARLARPGGVVGAARPEAISARRPAGAPAASTAP